MKNIRVRFAPSPTGILHIGGIRTAIYNYIYAKKNKGKFILRIEDTDKNRFIEEAEDYIIEILNWCGLSVDEGSLYHGKYGPYRQSNRNHLYDFYIQKLIENNHAYFAFDIYNSETKKNNFIYNSETRLQMTNSLSLDRRNFLDNFKKPYVIRFKTPKNKLISVYDEIRGEIKINTSSLDDKIIVKSDGMTSYHLANVVDDHLMKITHVIRGEEWLSSMPLHLLIYEAFNWKKPFFAHLPLILKSFGCGKLSKRDVNEIYIETKSKESIETNTKYHNMMKYFPETIVNMLTLLGWNPGKDKELFYIKKLEKQFSLKKVQKSGAFLNKDKIYWFNKQFLKKKSLEQLIVLFRNEFTKKSAFLKKNSLVKIIKITKTRISSIQDLWENVYYFFIINKLYNNQYITISNISVLYIIQKYLIKEKKIHSFKFKKIIKFLIYDHQIGLKNFFQILRISLIGILSGVDTLLIIEILGKKEIINRIRKFY